MPTRLTEMDIDKVSLVDQGANERRFALLKRQPMVSDPSAPPIEPAPDPTWLTKMGEWFLSLGKAPSDTNSTSPTTTVEKVTKREGDGKDYPASDYAYTPERDNPSTWKLRLTSSPGGQPDARIVGAAVAALGKGFRGNRVKIPADDLPAVKKRVLAAWRKANPEASADDVPRVLKADVTKQDTFADIVAQSDSMEALDEGFGVLRDGVWRAVFARDDDGEPLDADQKAALVTQNLDEFKAYILDAMTVAKRGAKISSARLAAIKQAFSVLGEVIEGVESGWWQPPEEAVAKETEMDEKELAAAIEKAADEAVAKALTSDAFGEAVAKAVKDAMPEPVETPVQATTSEADTDAVTTEQLAQVVEKLVDRINDMDRGRRQSLDGQEAQSDVQKSRWAGLL